MTEYQRGYNDALRQLASAMRKIMTPEQLAELRWTCDPLGEFLKVLREK